MAFLICATTAGPFLSCAQNVRGSFTHKREYCCVQCSSIGRQMAATDEQSRTLRHISVSRL